MKELNGNFKIIDPFTIKLDGMYKLINTSRNFNIDIYVIRKWLNNFDKTIIKNYIIDVDKKKIRKNGYIYIVTSDILNAVKIGMWRSSISSLLKNLNFY
jgi:hypothetical protein